MATGFGVGRDASGNGTTMEDIQRIIASTYENAGVMTGAVVSGRSDWQYHISAGAVVMDVGVDLAVQVPVFDQLIVPDPAPATGSRTDTIFVGQDFPGMDGSSLAYVGVSPTSAYPVVPAGAFVLDERTVPAGATATSSTTSVHDRQYALLSGASLGVLSYAADTDGAPRAANGTTYTRGTQRFVVPTDRDVDLQMTSTVSAANSDGTTAVAEGGAIYRLYIDGQLRKTFERGFNRWWETKQFTTTETVTAGAHTAEWRVTGSSANTSMWAVRYGGTDQYRGDTLAVVDRGVSV